MNGRLTAHPLWGAYSPLSSLLGAPLIIMASSRFSFALVCALALVWVYGFTALVFAKAQAIMPERGKPIIVTFLAVFFSGIFMLVVSLFNPLLIFGKDLIFLLIPACCLGTRLFESKQPHVSRGLIIRSLIEAVVLGGIILALALIREPLGMGTLSFPLLVQRKGELVEVTQNGGFVLLSFLSVSAGALVLLGYAVALFRYCNQRWGSGIVHDGDRT